MSLFSYDSLQNQGLKMLIVDDHPLYRSGLRMIFQNLPYISSIEEAGNGKECIELLRQNQPDIVLLDIHMPEMNGISCMKVIREHWPKLKVLVLSQYDELRSVNTLLNLGVGGYMMKTDSAQQLISAFEEIVFDNRAALNRALGRTNPREKMLQKREIEILKLLCRQLSSKQIAEQLYISKHTVDNHRKRILKKTGMQNTAGLVKWAIQNGFAAP